MWTVYVSRKLAEQAALMRPGTLECTRGVEIRRQVLSIIVCMHIKCGRGMPTTAIADAGVRIRVSENFDSRQLSE